MESVGCVWEHFVPPLISICDPWCRKALYLCGLGSSLGTTETNLDADLQGKLLLYSFCSIEFDVMQCCSLK